jgi:AcrR family transcriptional regulator
MRPNPPHPTDPEARPSAAGSRGEQTRRRLLQAASGLFTRTGYDGTAISDVAREAGVGVGTVYHHFPDKRALLLNLIDEFESAAQRALGPDGEGGPLSAAWTWDDTLGGITAAIRHIAALRPHPGLLPIATEVARWDEEVAARCESLKAIFRRTLQHDVEAGQRRGRVRPELDAGLAGSLLYDALDTGVRRLDEVPTDEERAEFVAALADLVHRYLVMR